MQLVKVDSRKCPSDLTVFTLFTKKLIDIFLDLPPHPHLGMLWVNSTKKKSGVLCSSTTRGPKSPPQLGHYRCTYGCLGRWCGWGISFSFSLCSNLKWLHEALGRRCLSRPLQRVLVFVNFRKFLFFTGLSYPANPYKNPVHIYSVSCEFESVVAWSLWTFHTISTVLHGHGKE